MKDDEVREKDKKGHAYGHDFFILPTGFENDLWGLVALLYSHVKGV
jgi:hypothetical protein